MAGARLAPRWGQIGAQKPACQAAGRASGTSAAEGSRPTKLTAVMAAALQQGRGVARQGRISAGPKAARQRRLALPATSLKRTVSR